MNCIANAKSNNSNQNNNHHIDSRINRWIVEQKKLLATTVAKFPFLGLGQMHNHILKILCFGVYMYAYMI